MTGNSELMDVVRKNVDNHHAKISDALYKKWIELNKSKRIESKESAFHLSVVIDLKTEVTEERLGSALQLLRRAPLKWRFNLETRPSVIGFLLILVHPRFTLKQHKPYNEHGTDNN